MALNHSSKISTDGLVFYYDMSNSKKSWKGRPITNNFILPTVDVNGFNVQFNTFTRIRSGNYGDFEIQPSDYVWRFDFTASSTCPYHGNDISVSTGVRYTFSFDYYVSTDAPAGGYGTRNLTLAAFEQAISGAVTDTTPSVVGVWKRAVFSGTTSSTNLRVLLYPGGCFTDGMSSTGYILFKNPQVEASASGDIPSPFIAGTRYANNNLENSPSYPAWNTNGSSYVNGTLTFPGGSYNARGGWDFFKTYSGLSIGVNYTWSALVKAGTSSNFIVTMNNTISWDTGPGITFSNLSTTEWRRVYITGTTSTGSFNLHLGASFNLELRDVVQTAGTIYIQDVRLYLTGSDTAIRDLTDSTTIDANNLTYDVDGTFGFNGSTSYLNGGNLGTNFENFTVEVWFKSDSVSNYRNPIDCNFGSYSSNTGPRLEQNSSGNLVWILGNAAGNYYTRTVVNSGLNPNSTHCAVITKNGSIVSSYYNGDLVESSVETYTHPGAMASINIGRGFTTSGERWFNGKIPSVKIYDRAISSTEVRQNFNALRGRYGI
jgi:hypothetical protein